MSRKISGNAATTASLGRSDPSHDGALVAGSDHDWFRLKLGAGLTYGFSLSGRGGDAAVTGGDLVLRSASGAVLARAETAAGAATKLSLVHTAAKGSTAFADVDADGAAGGYRLTLFAADTIARTTATGATLAGGGRVESAVDVRGDSDWVKVWLNAGLDYGFRLAGDDGDGDALAAGSLTLRDASGARLASVSGSGVLRLAESAGTSGTAYLEVKGGKGTGDYLLTGTFGDTVTRTTATEAGLADGARVSGRINVTGDADWYGFEVTEGVDYAFAVTGAGSARLGAPDLRLRDASGTLLAADTTGAAAALTWTAGHSGNVFLDVGGSGGTGGFRLSVVSTSATLTGTASADRLVGGDNAQVIRTGGGGDTAFGRDGNDRLYGGAGGDRLYGGEGSDRLYGGDGSDRLYGGEGNDRLYGGAGNDRLFGGSGADRLHGGSGADTFVFAKGGGHDVVLDFDAGADRISFTSGAAGYGDLAISDSAGGAHVGYSGGEIILQGVDAAALDKGDFLFA